MKKFLMLGVVLTGLSFASFADEVKEKEVIKTEILTEATRQCHGGQTTCGTTYMVCVADGLSSGAQLLLNDLYSARDCGEMLE